MMLECCWFCSQHLQVVKVNVTLNSMTKELSAELRLEVMFLKIRKQSNAKVHIQSHFSGMCTLADHNVEQIHVLLCGRKGEI